MRPELRRMASMLPMLPTLSRVASMVGPMAVALVVISASATGCEAIVGNQVPAYKCSDSDPASCPAGKVCATATGQCIVAAASCLVTPCAAGLSCDPGTLTCVSGIVEAGVDAGKLDGSTPGDTGAQGMDAGPMGPPYPVGHTCAKPSECTTALCADSAILGQDYFNKVGAVCTIPCCTSEQCPGRDQVCVGPGTGGKYCVPGAPLKRTLGSKAGGATCSAASECRSGLCIGDSGGTNKVCADSCCLDSQCGGTAKCRPVDVEGTGHKSYACSILPGGSTSFCSGAYDTCVSGICTTANSCESPCCGQATISGGATLCSAQNLANGDTFNFSNGGGTGTNDFGVACTLGTKCKSGYCDKVDGAPTGTCTDVCCTDADCTAPNICRPRVGMMHFLRCVTP